MQAGKPTFALIILIGSLLCGCNPSQDPLMTPTRSGESIISTAEAYAEQTRQATAQTPLPTPITPSPTAVQETSTPEPTETPSIPIVTANYNAYVRNGPDEVYQNIDYLLAGQPAEVIGRFENNNTGTWWYIRRIGEGKDGWIWGGAVTLSGYAGGVLVLEAPPTPTPTE